MITCQLRLPMSNISAFATLIGILAVTTASHAIQQLQDNLDRGVAKKWVLLVATSNGWNNYRHQADICHAYHVVRNHGVPAENIIVMMYDDIANNKLNPRRGKIFNSPAKRDVYGGVRIDYRGKDVTVKNFFAALSGNSSAVRGGTGRVINSTNKDKIFVYLSDHGAVGYIPFPNWPQGDLTAKDLSETLYKMHKNKQYSELTFYLEACESGSMFDGKILPASLNIYAMTASSPNESSHGCYCNDPELGTCLGDHFSVNWMDDSDRHDLTSETLKTQYEVVKKKTNDSHVCTYGNLSLMKEKVSEFQGKNKSTFTPSGPVYSPFNYPIWPSRDIPLLSLIAKRDRESDEDKKTLLVRQIKALQKKRQYLDSLVVALVEQVVGEESDRERVLNTHPSHLDEHLECHHNLVNTFNQLCFGFANNPYALKYVKVLANFCELAIETDSLVASLKHFCSQKNNGIQNIV